MNYNGGQYGMASKQIPFKMSLSNKEVKISNLYYDIGNLLEGFNIRYRIEYVDTIQILYVVTVDIPELKINNRNKIKLNKEFNKIKETKELFSSKFIPLTVNTDYYGEFLTIEQGSRYINIINDSLEVLNMVRLELNDISSIYLYSNKYILVNKNIDNNKIIRKVYSSISGVLYLEALDVIIDQSTFTRTIGRSTFTISDNKVSTILSSKELLPIKNMYKPYKASSNPFIGTLDLEAYVDSDGYSKVYAIGFYTKIESDKGESPITYYIDNNRD
jgi:hypothetical protein